MIILDTNVLSEVTRREPEPRILNWLDRQLRTDLVTTSITVAEMSFGVEGIAPGKRRNDLARLNEAALGLMAAILPFSVNEAPAYGAIVADMERRGRQIKPFDAQIAAIAQIRGAALATRNTMDFEGCQIDLINPWDV
jgi:predicted nucleic acid-binding protein